MLDFGLSLVDWLEFGVVRLGFVKVAGWVLVLIGPLGWCWWLLGAFVWLELAYLLEYLV